MREKNALGLSTIVDSDNQLAVAWSHCITLVADDNLVRTYVRERVRLATDY
jgi:hypothetical protein